MSQYVYSDDWVSPSEIIMPQNVPHSVAHSVPLLIGDSVKINNGRERFFVTVEQIDGEIIVGRVDNHLLQLKKYQQNGIQNCPYTYGDMVCFERKHIWQVHSQSDKLRISLEVQKFIEQQLALGVDKQELIKRLTYFKRIVPSDAP